MTTVTSRTMCPMNCHPTLCGMQVTTDAGKVLGITGDKENPDSRGFLCQRGQAAREIIDNPRRLLTPRMRDRRAGKPWRAVGWDQALDHIASTIDRLGRDNVAMWTGHGAVANNFGTFVNLRLAERLACLGGLQFWDASMLCWGLGAFGVALTGALEVNTKEDMGENSDMVVLWGANLASQPNTARHVAAVKRRGGYVVAIDVRSSEACRNADEALIVRPGSDAALALAMMHVLVDEHLCDLEFIAEHTVGFDAIADHVRSFSPRWAAPITGIEADRIASLARTYAKTARAMLLLGGASMYKSVTGWESSRAISCLPAMTGKIGKPGSGLGPRHMGMAHGFELNTIVDTRERPPGDYVPTTMPAINDAVSSGRIRGLLQFGSNLISSFADSGPMEAGLENQELVVWHDLFMSDEAERFADVVLPGTSWLEEVGCKATNTHLYLMDKILEAPGQTRSLASVCRSIADLLGIKDFYPWAGETGHIDAILDHPSTSHMTVDTLRANGGIAPLNVSPVAHPDLRFATPSGKIEFQSPLAESLGLPALPHFTQRESGSYPLELRMGRTLQHFHAFYNHSQALPSLAKLEDGPQVWISEADASVRLIGQGDTIRLVNQRGEFAAVANVTPQIPVGTLWIHDGWPGLNRLTSGAPTLPDTAVDAFPFSVGQAAYEAWVEVEPVGASD